jgi:SPP1 family predicted phage head-tail adaptor
MTIGQAFLREGRLRHRITIEEPVFTRDGLGGVSVVWRVVAVVWGAIEDRSGMQSPREDRGGQAVSSLVVIRWREGLTSEMRFRVGLRSFEIIGVLDRDGRRRFAECTVIERKA